VTTKNHQHFTRYETPKNIGDLSQDLLRRWDFDPESVVSPVDHHPQFRECERHGAYPISMVDGAGVVRYMASSCPVCAAEQVSRRLLESAAISARHQGCDFASFIVETPAQQAVLDTCRDYAEHFSQAAATGAGLIFSGPVGTGKNHLATAIARTVLEMGRSVLQVTAYEMILRLRQTWKKDDTGPSEAAIIRQFGAADLLIIDEVGKQFGSKGGDEVQLFAVINRRYLDMKPTIVMSNESAQGIERYMGIAAFDRLCERGLLLEFDGPSHRRGHSA
jgi:DNA replication protein DnaC